VTCVPVRGTDQRCGDEGAEGAGGSVSEAVKILRRELERAERELHSLRTELPHQKGFLQESTNSYKGFLQRMDQAEARRDAFLAAISALSEEAA
jgi:hypothetical protein